VLIAELAGFLGSLFIPLVYIFHLYIIFQLSTYVTSTESGGKGGKLFFFAFDSSLVGYLVIRVFDGQQRAFLFGLLFCFLL